MRFFLFLLFIFCGFYAIAQDSIWLKQTKIREAINFEKAISTTVTFLNQNVGLGEGFYPLDKKYRVTNPIIAKREPAGTLQVYAEYFYTPEDSVIRLVSYDWEKDKYGNFFKKQKMWEKEADSLENYNRTYEIVRDRLVKLLGKPTATDKAPATVKSDRGDYLTRESVWEKNNIHVELNMVFESMTYRVRMTYYWKD